MGQPALSSQGWFYMARETPTGFAFLKIKSYVSISIRMELNTVTLLPNQADPPELAT